MNFRILRYFGFVCAVLVLFGCKLKQANSLKTLPDGAKDFFDTSIVPQFNRAIEKYCKNYKCTIKLTQGWDPDIYFGTTSVSLKLFYKFDQFYNDNSVDLKPWKSPEDRRCHIHINEAQRPSNYPAERKFGLDFVAIALGMISDFCPHEQSSLSLVAFSNKPAKNSIAAKYGAYVWPRYGFDFVEINEKNNLIENLKDANISIADLNIAKNYTHAWEFANSNVASIAKAIREDADFNALIYPNRPDHPTMKKFLEVSDPYFRGLNNQDSFDE